MGGMEVLRAATQIRTSMFRPIVITAHGSIETASRLERGAYDFITKPIDANHFDIVVRNLWSG